MPHIVWLCLYPQLWVSFMVNKWKQSRSGNRGSIGSSFLLPHGNCKLNTKLGDHCHTWWLYTFSAWLSLHKLNYNKYMRNNQCSHKWTLEWNHGTCLNSSTHFCHSIGDFPLSSQRNGCGQLIIAGRVATGEMGEREREREVWRGSFPPFM